MKGSLIILFLSIISFCNAQFLDKMECLNEHSIGQKLSDATMNMKINMSGTNMSMTVEITDREVIGKETITSPAGSFNCFVITYATDMKRGMCQRSSLKQ